MNRTGLGNSSGMGAPNVDDVQIPYKKQGIVSRTAHGVAGVAKKGAQAAVVTTGMAVGATGLAAVASKAKFEKAFENGFLKYLQDVLCEKGKLSDLEGNAARGALERQYGRPINARRTPALPGMMGGMSGDSGYSAEGSSPDM